MEELGPTVVGAGASAGRIDGPLCLLVIGDGTVTTHPLPTLGAITIGRADSNDVRVDEPSISREHARIHAGAELLVEDLGSANGTRVHDRRLEPNEMVAIRPGQAFEVGSTTVIVQRTSIHHTRTRLWSHAYFEARLEDECARPRQTAAPFAVVRVRLGSPATAVEVQEGLTSVLRPTDIVASYAPSEYELLLVDASPARVEAVTSKIEGALAALQVEARVSGAVCPGDGRAPDELLAVANRRLASTSRARDSVGPHIVADPAMKDLYRVAERVARGSISVLLLGETGVGKEVVAEALHRASPRRDRPYVRLNCAALSESLLESELFGYEKGAFTGAERSKPGLLETADRGTVFLDELGEMPAPLQAKLLRVLEQRQVLRVGGLEPRSIDVRFLSATNRDLEQEIEAGRFRRDLFYRLNGVMLHVPPLRERVMEIPLLTDAFLEQICVDNGFEVVPRLSDRVRELLAGYDWPGNVRELRNVLERALLLCPGDRIEVEHLPVDKMTASWGAADAIDEDTNTASGALPDRWTFERNRILAALKQCKQNQTRAAGVLGVSRRTLTTWLDKYDVPRPRKRSSRRDGTA